MNDYSKFLKEAYGSYMLPLGGKKVPAPYRINIPYQSDPKRNGKSPPLELIKNTKEAAKEQDFDLEKATVEEIQQFMYQNMLGIDCSGFVYHLLDDLLKNIDKVGMEEIGFPRASRTNVEILTSGEFTDKINISDIQPGDLIRLNSDSASKIQHIIIAISKELGFVTYGHSSRKTAVKGVHKDNISYGKLPHELHVYSYNPGNSQDGVYRLKALQ